jgi:hypothetical protein
LERLLIVARHNEASALEKARRKEREKFQSAILEKETRIAELEAKLVQYESK